MREFIDQHNFGAAGEYGVDVHFLKHGALVVDLFAGNRRQLIREFDNTLAAVGFDNADNNIFSPVGAADGLAEHAVGFADTWSIA